MHTTRRALLYTGLLLVAVPAAATPDYYIGGSIEAQGEGKWAVTLGLDLEGCSLAMKAPEVMLADFAAANKSSPSDKFPNGGVLGDYLVNIGPFRVVKVQPLDGQRCHQGRQNVRLDIVKR